MSRFAAVFCPRAFQIRSMARTLKMASRRDIGFSGERGHQSEHG
jgi:hypothetical protein